MLSTDSTDTAERLRVFRAVAPRFGTILPAAFFQKTRTWIPEIRLIHNLAQGIFKPAWSNYALSISSMLSSRYSDKVDYNLDRTWWINYSPKAGGMNLVANASLVRCMTDHQPVLVLRQRSDKFSKEGSHYHLLGLGFVEAFDPPTDLFRIRGLDWNEVSTVLDLGGSDDLAETALWVESLKAWTPFVAEDRGEYQVSRQRRDAAFREVVLANYDRTCAVTGQRFHSASHTEADGAHIIGKEARGTDDPRNGIALSKSVHWAFDLGIFRISDQYEVVINPKARTASVADFPLLEMDRKKIHLPTDDYYWPHPDALEWHRREVFEKFAL